MAAFIFGLGCFLFLAALPLAAYGAFTAARGERITEEDEAYLGFCLLVLIAGFALMAAVQLTLLLV